MIEDTQREKRIATLAIGGGVSLGGRIASRLLILGTQVVLARSLGAATFGLYALGATVLKLASIIATAGLDKGVIRFGTPVYGVDDDELRGVLGKCLALAVGLGFLFGGPLWFFSEQLAEHVFRKPDLTGVIRWFALVIPLAVLVRVLAAISRISKRVQFGVLAEDLVQPGLNLILILLLFWQGWRLEGALIAAVASYAAAALAAIMFLLHLFPGLFPPRLSSRLRWREILSFSTQSLLGATFTILILAADRLFLGFFRPAADLGVYQIVAQLSLLIPMLAGSFAAVIAPLFADLNPGQDRAGMDNLYRAGTRWSVCLTVPPFLLLAFSGEELLALLFGPEYSHAWLPLLILASGQMVNAATGPVSLLLLMTGQQSLWFRISGVVFVAGLALNLLLIPPYGIVGAAVSTALTVAGLFIAGLIGVGRVLGVHLYDRTYLRLTTSALAAAATAFAISRLPMPSATLALTLPTVAGATVFYCFLFWKSMHPEDALILSAFRTRMMGRNRP